MAEKQNKKLVARNAAVARLIRADRSLYESFMQEEFRRLGLGEYTPERTPEEREQAKRQAKIRAAQDKVRKAQAELDALTEPVNDDEAGVPEQNHTSF